MLYSLPSAAGYQLAGLKTLLLAPWSGVALYAYATAACSQITNFSGLTGWEYVSCEPGAGGEFGQASTKTKNGNAYAQAVNVTLSGLSADRRTAVEALLEAGPVVALCQDFTGQWWLYGQTAGLRLLTVSPKSGEMAQTLALTGTQRAAARTVAQSRLNLLYNSSTLFHLPS